MMKIGKEVCRICGKPIATRASMGKVEFYSVKHIYYNGHLVECPLCHEQTVRIYYDPLGMKYRVEKSCSCETVLLKPDLDFAADGNVYRIDKFLVCPECWEKMSKNVDKSSGEIQV